MADKARIATRRSLSFTAPASEFEDPTENLSKMMKENPLNKEEKSIHEMFGKHLAKILPQMNQIPELMKNIRERDFVAENLQENIKKQHQQKLLQARLCARDLVNSPPKDVTKHLYSRETTKLIPSENSPLKKVNLQKFNSTISDYSPHEYLKNFDNGSPPKFENRKARAKTPNFRRFQSSKETHTSELDRNDVNKAISNIVRIENSMNQTNTATITLDNDHPVLSRFKSSSFHNQEGAEKKYKLLQIMKIASDETHQKFAANIKILSKVAKGVDVLHKVIYSNLPKKSQNVKDLTLNDSIEGALTNNNKNCEETSVQFVHLLKEKLVEKINSRKIENKISKTSIQDYLLDLLNLYTPLINQTIDNDQEDIAVILLNLVKIHTIEFEDILASYNLNLDTTTQKPRKEDTEEIKVLKRKIKEQDTKIRTEELRYSKSLLEAEKKYEQSLKECQILQNLLKEKAQQHK